MSALKPLNVRVENSLTLWLEPGPQKLAEFKGFAIDPDGFPDFLDGVDVRRQSVAYEQAHGDYDIPGTLASRSAVFSGWCRADDPEQLRLFGRQLTGSLLQAAAGAILVDFSDEVLRGRARRTTKPKFKPRPHNPRIADWQLQTWFPNPRLFGDSRRCEAGEAAANYGNFAATPRITVTGSAPGYTLNGPAGKKYTVTRALASGVPHVIDMADGYLMVGGVIVSGGVGKAQRWAIPGGGSAAVTVTPSSGTASVSQVVTDTYV